MCPTQKFRHTSSKETSRKALQGWHLGSRAELAHTHSLRLLSMFSGNKKTTHKTILMALTGVAKELYNATALLPRFVLFSRSLPCLWHSWEKGTPDSCPPCQLTAGSTDTCVLLLGFVSSQLERESGASVPSLPCFPWWKPGCVMPANPGLGHARTWGWQKGPGLSKAPGGKTQLLRGLLSTPPHVRLLIAAVHVSSPFCTHLAHLSGRGIRKEYYAVPERGQRPIIQQLPELLMFLLYPQHSDLLNCQPH